MPGVAVSLRGAFNGVRRSARPLRSLIATRREGWVCLAVLRDCFSRRVVGWSLSRQIDAELVCAALEMALRRRCPQGDLVHHSDRGVQYASQTLRQLLQQAGLARSISPRG